MRRKKIMTMVYGLGAAIVILGALFKIMHWPGGNTMLIIGLITESLVFTASAFEPVDDELDWSLVYPELSGGSMRHQSKEEALDEQGLLSQKLDEMLREAKIDSTLMSNLSDSIREFHGAAQNMSPTIDAIESQKNYSSELANAAGHMKSLNDLYEAQVETTDRQVEINNTIAENAESAFASQRRYSEELTHAAEQMESLNNLYKVQVESSGRQAEINDAVAENAGRLKDQMESLTSNLSSLNGVYGGMLTAMNRPSA